MSTFEDVAVKAMYPQQALIDMSPPEAEISADVTAPLIHRPAWGPAKFDEGIVPHLQGDDAALGLAERGPELLLLGVAAEGQVRLRPLQRQLLIAAGCLKVPDARAQRLVLRCRPPRRLADIVQLALGHAELDLRPELLSTLPLRGEDV